MTIDRVSYGKTHLCECDFMLRSRLVERDYADYRIQSDYFRVRSTRNGQLDSPHSGVHSQNAAEVWGDKFATHQNKSLSGIKVMRMK